MKYITPLLILLLCSCSAEKRLQRLTALHPELVKSDTVKVDYPVYLIGVEHDTIFDLSYDTTFIDTGRLHIVHVIDSVTKKVYVAGRCDADTVTITVDKIVNTVSPQKVVYTDRKNHIHWLWLFVALACGMWLRSQFKSI